MANRLVEFVAVGGLFLVGGRIVVIVLVQVAAAELAVVRIDLVSAALAMRALKSPMKLPLTPLRPRLVFLVWRPS